MLGRQITAVLACASAALAIPNWGAMGSRNVGSVVEIAGQTNIEAMGPADFGPNPTKPGSSRHYLTVDVHGKPGNAMIKPANGLAPRFFAPKFFISPRDQQLYQVVNSTTIFPVNLYNITEDSIAPAGPESQESPIPLQYGTRQAPLRLSTAPNREGQTNGFWRWQGPMLYYETTTSVMKDGHIQGTNNGIFYKCFDRHGVPGVYMSLTPIPTPYSCVIVTLHSDTVSGADF